MKKILLLAAIVLTICACTDPEGARRALEASGYKDIQITGWEPLNRSEKDFYSTGFVAVAPSGARVSGAVSKGLLFKGSTVRLD